MNQTNQRDAGAGIPVNQPGMPAGDSGPGEKAGWTLGRIVAGDIRRAQILDKYGLDFCCGGAKSLNAACAEKGLDTVQIEQELRNVNETFPIQDHAYNEWPLAFLADYIVNTHHRFVKQSLPGLKSLAEKVMKAHGAKHGELEKLLLLVELINRELPAHMLQEEELLFPYIKELDSAKNFSSIQLPFAGNIQGLIDTMESEHELVGGSLAEIRELTGNYHLPEDACTSYGLLFTMLQEFEADLHIHVHLENNILFPKTLLLEKGVSLA